ncbi:MAG TPA: PAS domain-containing protein [Kineosporiaceae bacterium]|nr:PAS domain-containing protein [Kineosporiaceae bacterium]
MWGRRRQAASPDRPEAPRRRRREAPGRIMAALRGEQALGILDASGDAVLAVAADGSVAYANAMAAEVFAAPTTVLTGQPAELLVPQLASVVQALRDRRAAGDLTVGPAGPGAELGALRLDGIRFPATVWVTPLRTRRGMLVAATVRDLTRQHETDARVRRFAARAQEQQDVVAAVLAAVTEVALVLADGRGRVTAANRATEKLLGCRAEELVGQPTTALSDPGELAAAAAELGVAQGCDPLLELARSGLPTGQDWVYVARDGTRRPVSLRVTAVGDPREPTGFVYVAVERAAAWEPVLASRGSGDRLLLELDDAPTRALRWQVSGGWARRR